jgi:4-amino-4-deoxy-L-arabinose transferase-like glycosyltransferase
MEQANLLKELIHQIKDNKLLSNHGNSLLLLVLITVSWSMLFTHRYFSFYELEVQSKGGGNRLIGVARGGNGGGFGFHGKSWQKHSSMLWLLLTESLTYITILPFAHTDIGNREGAAGQGRGGGLQVRGVARG